MDSSIFLQNRVLILMLSDLITLFMLSIASFKSIKILLYWDFKSSSFKQYDLEKSNYITSLIISLSSIFFIAEFIFFIYVIESLHQIVPGAMCGAGVISSNSFGYPLLTLKIVLIFLFSFWRILNKEDLKAINYPYIKRKYLLFLATFIIYILSLYIEIKYFTNIPLDKVVNCCSVIYGYSGNNSIPLNLNKTSLLSLFYLFAILNIYAIWQKMSYLLLISSIIFLFISYFSLIYIFNIYIYELPTHICPFCVLESDYYYIGYILWGSLLISTFYSIANGLLRVFGATSEDRYYKFAFIALMIFLFISNFYPIRYYITNGKLL